MAWKLQAGQDASFRVFQSNQIPS
uniref:Uncharacterized protein n=1 Tax=Arundo donax TaxID=35708 RepID=A0A0A9BX79_ARUDO